MPSLPSSLELVVPSHASYVITQNPSTGLLKTYSIEIAGDVSGATTITTTSCNSTTSTTTGTITGGTIDSTGSYQLDGVDVITITGNNSHMNCRVIRNLSTTAEGDGMHVNLSSTGGGSAHLRLYTGSNHLRMMIRDDSGKVGIGTDSPQGMLHISNTSVPYLQRSIILGYNNATNYVASGMNCGNDDNIPRIWSGSNGTSTVNGSHFTFGFGWCYKSKGGNYLLGTFGSDDRWKFNETKITNVGERV